MNGRYRIALGAGEEPEQNHLVRKLLAMLPPGAQYTMQVHAGQWRSTTGSRYAEILAHGGKERRRAKASKPSIAPPVPTAEQLRKRLAEARVVRSENLKCLKANLRQQWQEDAWGCTPEAMIRKVERRRLHQRIGRAVGRILRAHGVKPENAGRARITAEDYALLDLACARKVNRQSRVSGAWIERCGGYLGWVVLTYADGYGFGRKGEAIDAAEPARPSYVMRCVLAGAEVAHAAELLRLAIDRGENV